MPNAHARLLSDISHNVDTSEEKGKYCISFSKLDHSLCVINKANWTKVASFKLDGDVSACSLCFDLSSIHGKAMSFLYSFKVTA